MLAFGFAGSLAAACDFTNELGPTFTTNAGFGNDPLRSLGFAPSRSWVFLFEGILSGLNQ